MSLPPQEAPISLPSVVGLLPEHDLLLCDLWGVVHDGHQLNPNALSVFEACKTNNVKIVLLSNAPRPSESVVEKLSVMGLAREAYDHIVTSGDVALSFSKTNFLHKKAYLLGDAHDRALIDDGVSFQWVDDVCQADFVFAMGFAKGQQLKDFNEAFLTMKQAGLAMICANADKWVHVGHHLLPCAGLMAEAYQSLGGEVHMFGKPHDAVYDRSFALAACDHRTASVLVIGDNMETDIQGAVNIKATSVLVTSGVHRDAFAGGQEKSPIELFASIRPDYMIESLA